MGFVIDQYKKGMLHRFDFEEFMPPFSAADFPGLRASPAEFKNRAGDEVRYFTYSYEGCRHDKLILFCHGLGPGHSYYLSEIEALCRAGYRVLTLDFSGCGSSGGKKLASVNAPTKDALELLELIKPEEELVPVGHSLGGYTALNLAHLLPSVTRAVIISGFISISDEMMGFLKLRLLADRIKRFEEKLDPQLGALDNLSYLKTTNDKLLWIHSMDDPVVNYRYNAGKLKKLGCPSVRVIAVEKKKHTPQYSAEAIKTMDDWMGRFYRMIKEGKLASTEERKAYFDDKPVKDMTAQDPCVWEEILWFIEA